MLASRPAFRAAAVALFSLALTAAGSAFALQPRHAPSRFDQFVRVAPSAGLPLVGRSAMALPASTAARQAWDRFVAEQGGGWQGWFDERSGLPSLTEGRGIPWLPATADTSDADATIAQLEKLARAFMDAHADLLGGLGPQLLLDRAASGRLGQDAWQVTFRQAVSGVPVDGARYNFRISHGNLVAFGASAIVPVQRDVTPRLSVADAQAALDRYLGTRPGELTDAKLAELLLVPVDPRGAKTVWNGAIGGGYRHELVWQFTQNQAGGPATWVSQVSADTGEVLAFFDDTKYERIMGGVFPVSNDGICTDGCEQPDYPLPYAEYSENGGPTQYTGSTGIYNCAVFGSNINTKLIGKYIRVSDSCGQANETVTCDNPIDFQSSPGTDCQVPSGRSAGDTHAARSSFYHLNRSMELGRAWLPSNSWLQSQVTDNLNINSTCNAYWNGSVNFYRSGGGCRNTGEIAGVFVHEWGHGLDANDGGGYDNPSEAYADTVAVLYTHVSCVGRGFYVSGNCGGYGDACLDCTGIRDQDWDKHVSHTPATASWVQSHCGGGGGPCGAEPHCEAYISTEAVYDLATRDLPAAGMGAASAWQQTDQLWYLSRNGSGGNAYNCAGSTSDGCNSDSWFHKFRVADDDDGNLNNGTPHAAAIYAAFARHGIACGAAGDASNQNTSTCPVLAQPQIGVTAGSNANTISWTAVPGAVSYTVLRNDLGCSYGQTIIAKPAAPATSYVDTPVPNGFTLNYRVQAVGAQQACVSPVSDCVTSAAQPFAGSVSFDKGVYPCSATLQLRVTDGNVIGPRVDVLVWSDTEPNPETLTLTRSAEGSARFIGSLPLLSGPAVHGDGKLSISPSDILSSTYFDADDGTGNGATSYSTATLDCRGPQVSDLAVQTITDARATIHFTTAEPGNTFVDWGSTPALGQTTSASALTTTHDLLLNQFTQCQDVYFKIRTTDQYGNTTVYDNQGSPFLFHTWQIPGLYYKDSFENGINGWTLGGEWQIGAPSGKGGSSGLADPTSPYNNQNVLGLDLTGLGAHPGDYEPNRTDTAKSKVLNATTWQHTKLVFYRRLQSGVGDEATIYLYAPAGLPLYRNTDGVFDADYSYQSFDLSGYVDGKANVQIEFREKTDASSFYSGWNIDELIFKDGTKPDWATCGGCGAAPSFAGTLAATDNNPCGSGGVTVSWNGAASWGTGNGGTYSVYRGTAPGFAADAAHRIALGLTGLSYNDASASAGQFYYLVRAENDETCSTGPRNGGVTDTNTNYVGVTNTSTHAAPGPIGTLQASRIAKTHVRLSWTAPTESVSYNVYRSTTPQPAGFAVVSQSSATYYDDLGAALTPDNYFYLARGVNACGTEGP